MRRPGGPRPDGLRPMGAERTRNIARPNAPERAKPAGPTREHHVSSALENRLHKGDKSRDTLKDFVDGKVAVAPTAGSNEVSVKIPPKPRPEHNNTAAAPEAKAPVLPAEPAPASAAEAPAPTAATGEKPATEAVPAEKAAAPAPAPEAKAPAPPAEKAPAPKAEAAKEDPAVTELKSQVAELRAQLAEVRSQLKELEGVKTDFQELGAVAKQLLEQKGTPVDPEAEKKLGPKGIIGLLLVVLAGGTVTGTLGAIKPDAPPAGA